MRVQTSTDFCLQRCNTNMIISNTFYRIIKSCNRLPTSTAVDPSLRAPLSTRARGRQPARGLTVTMRCVKHSLPLPLLPVALPVVSSVILCARRPIRSPLICTEDALRTARSVPLPTLGFLLHFRRSPCQRSPNEESRRRPPPPRPQ